MDIIGQGQPGADGQPAAPAAAPATPAPATPAPAAPATPPAADQPPAATPPAADQQPPAQPNIYELVSKANLKDLLPPDLRENPYLARVNDLPTLVKNYTESQTFISQSVRLPGEDATEQQKAEFYNKLGRPENPDGYAFSLVEDLTKNGVTLDDANAKWFKDAAHEANLTNEAANKILNVYAKMQMQEAQTYAASIEAESTKTVEALQAKWRGDFKDNINLINSRLDNFFPKEVQAVLKEKGLMRDQAFIEAMLGLTKNVTGDNLFIEGGNLEADKSELQQLETKRRELMMAPDRRQRQSEEFDINKQITELKQKLNQSE